MKNITLTLILLAFSFMLHAQKGKSRSAKTGQYVTKSYANSHPSTTYTSKKK